MIYFQISKKCEQCFFIYFSKRSCPKGACGVENFFLQKMLILTFDAIMPLLVQYFIIYLNYRAIFDAPLKHECLTSVGTCIKNCSIVKDLIKC